MSLFQKTDSTKGDRSYWLTLPMLVPDANDLESKNDEAFIKRHERFLDLPKNVKEKLASVGISQKIQIIGQKYGFELLRLANITRLVREYYFGEVRFENFPEEIEKRVGVSLLTAQEITRYLKSEIIDWDPWAEYLAKLPKMPIREIAQKFPKIAGMEITAGYIELKGSDDLEDPTIKNWLKDYISHLGYDRHSQMDRAQYIFHSENGKNLSSPDREKLGIILKSFDENIPLPVDEENGEIVFDIAEPASSSDRQKSPSNSPFSKGGEATGSLPFVKEQKSFPLSQRGIKGDFEKEASKQDSFIKPYSPIQQPQKQAPRPAPIPTMPPRPQPRPTSPQPSPYKGEGDRPEIDKYFNAPETSDIPTIKIHSITEYNEPKIVPHVPPRPTIQRPVQTSPQPSPYQGEGAARPKYKIIDPFFSKPRPEPKLDGNIVDLSEQ